VFGLEKALCDVFDSSGIHCKKGTSWLLFSLSCPLQICSFSAYSRSFYSISCCPNLGRKTLLNFFIYQIIISLALLFRFNKIKTYMKKSEIYLNQKLCHYFCHEKNKKIPYHFSNLWKHYILITQTWFFMLHFLFFLEKYSNILLLNTLLMFI
jgi:hypothetical protein